MSGGPSRATVCLRLLCACVALLSITCGGDKRLPPAPSELTTGIVIYEDANYRGSSAHITGDVANLEDFRGPCYASDNAGQYSSGEFNWNDCISSVRVAPGWRATFYGDDKFRGGRIEVTSDIPDLKRVPGDCSTGMNDCVSSIRLSRQ